MSDLADRLEEVAAAIVHGQIQHSEPWLTYCQEAAAALRQPAPVDNSTVKTALIQCDEMRVEAEAERDRLKTLLEERPQLKHIDGNNFISIDHTEYVPWDKRVREALPK